MTAHDDGPKSLAALAADASRAAPVHRVPVTPVDWQSLPTFCCRCQIHQATNHKPICPVCLDDIRREEQR